MCLAVPGKVLGVEERDGTRMATVDFGGVVKEVCLEYLPDDEESARKTLELFENLGMLQEEFGDPWETAADANGTGVTAHDGAGEVRQ
jgi:hydrogenase expression/formation protein HypC